MMKKMLLLALALACGALAVPSIAGAHTGTVTCDSTGVVFSYRANFERTTTVTETVTTSAVPMSRTVVVQRWTALKDTWVGVTGTATASASWKGGGIKAVTLTCPAPPAPPVTPAPPVAPPVAPPAVPVAPPVTPSNVPASVPVVTPKTAATCPKGTLDLGVHGKVKMCLRVVRVPAKKKPGHHATKPAHKAKKPKFHGAGVAG